MTDTDGDYDYAHALREIAALQARAEKAEAALVEERAMRVKAEADADNRDDGWSEALKRAEKAEAEVARLRKRTLAVIEAGRILAEIARPWAMAEAGRGTPLEAALAAFERAEKEGA